MMSKYFGILLIALGLVACGGAEDRKAEHMSKGKALYGEGNYEKARLEFKNVLKIDPKDPGARYELARVMEKLQNWKGAVGNYLGAIKLEPAHVDARVRLGQIYLAGKATDKAGEMAEAAYELARDNPDVLALRSGVKAQQGDLEDALAEGLRALEIAPEHVNAIAITASVYIKSGKRDEAIATLKDGIGRNPDSTALRALLAAVYIRQGKGDQAAALLGEIVSLEPDNLAHRVRLAALYSGLGRLEESEKALRAAMAAVPESVPAKLALVDFLAKKRGKAVAEKELLTLIEREPKEYTLRFGLARLYEAAGEVEKAKEVYQDIIAMGESSPQSLQAKNKLASWLVRQNKLDQAGALVSEVLKENPRDFEALILKGSIALVSKDASSAIADFRSLLRDRPNSPRASSLLAKAHLLNKETELAMETLRKAVESNPENSQLRLDLAKLLVRTGETEQAVQKLQEGVKAAPGDVVTLEALAKLQMMKKDWPAALETTGRIKSARPELPLGYYLAGTIYQARREYGASSAEFELAVRKAPGTAEPLSALVKTYLVQEKPDAALASLETIITEMPQHFVAHNLRGEVLMLKEQHDGAEKAFRRAMELKPGWVIPYRNLASVRLSQGDNDAAVKVFQDGLRTSPDSPALRIGLASLYERLEKYDLAIAQYEILLKTSPESQAAANNMAMMLASYRQDRESLDKAMELSKRLEDTRNVAYLDTIGWVHYKRGDLDAALPILEKAVRHAPNSPELLYHLGMANFSKGNVDLARAQLQRAIDSKRLFRGVEEARTTLEKIAGT